ncbi:MAG: molybdenum cofactor biosynthesis protein MoaE [Planctomycetota bacterium]
MNFPADDAVRLHDGPLNRDADTPAECGAVLIFEGVVRPNEPDGEASRPLVGLRYEAYEPMTSRELGRLVFECEEEFGAVLRVEHSVGDVPVGACSFRLHVATPHRAAALACCRAFIEHMKRDVPLWKTPLWA